MKIFTYSALVFLLMPLIFLCGCQNDEGLASLPVVTIEEIQTTYNTVKVDIKTEGLVSSYKFAIGGKQDRASFLAGYLPGIKEVKSDTDTEYVFGDLVPDTEYRIFAVAENQDGERGELTVLTVMTSALGNAVVEISEKAVTDKSLTVTLTPKDDITYFEYAVGLPRDLEGFRRRELSGIEKVAGTESIEKTFGGLEYDTEYAVFAVGYNSVGEPGDVSMARIVTSAPEKPSIRLNVITVLPNSIEVDFYASSNTASFDFAIGNASDEEKFSQGILEGIETVDKAGEFTHTFDGLSPGREYTIFARGTDRNSVKGEIFSVSVKAAEPDVEIEIEKSTIVYADVYTMPNKFCGKYKTLLMEKARYESTYNYFASAGWSDDRIFQIISMGTMDVTQGQRSRYILGEKATDYIVVIGIYDTGSVFYRLKTQTFTTPDVDSQLALPESVKIEMITLGAYNSKIRMTPGKNTTGFYRGGMSKSEYYAMAEGKSESEIIDWLVANLDEFALSYGYQTEENIWSNAPDNDIVMLAVPFNDNGKYGFGPLTVFEYHSPAAIQE